jgi:hypothetical protein
MLLNKKKQIFPLNINCRNLSNERNFDSEWKSVLLKIARRKTCNSSLPNTNMNFNQMDACNLIGANLEELAYIHPHYFNKKFLNDLDRILSEFDSRRNNKKVVQNNLDLLSQTESYWKNLTKKSQHELETLKEIFDRPLILFKRNLNNIFTFQNKNPTQRSYVHEPRWKIKIFLTGFLDFLVNKQDMVVLAPLNNLFVNESDNKHVDVLIEKYIRNDEKWIFFDITRIVLRKVYDNLYNPSFHTSEAKRAQILNENSFIVNRQSVFYDFRRILALYLLNMLIIYYLDKLSDLEKESSDIFKNYSNILEVVRSILWRKSFLYDNSKNSWWNLELSQFVSCLLQEYQRCEVIDEFTEEFEKGTNRQIVKWVVPIRFENAIMRYTQLPMVACPAPVTDNDIDNSLTQSLFGENFIYRNSMIKEILTIKQKKCFKVNKSYLLLLKVLNNLEKNSFLDKERRKKNIKLDLPFPFKSDFEDLENKIESLESNFGESVITKICYDELHKKFVGLGVNNLYLDQLQNICGKSKISREMEKHLNEMKLEKDIYFQKIKYANSCIRMAESYSNVPIYFTNTICVRLRMYPKQPMISRTSGQFKQLLCDKTEIKLTISGYVELFRCYYRSVSENSLEVFEKYLSKVNLSKKTGKKELYNFFRSNPVKLADSEVFLYSSLLHTEILKAEVSGKTGVNVEIDQVASVLAFLALFFRNRKLARVANLLGGDFKCPYSYIMDYMTEKFKSNVKFSEKGHFLVTKDRKTTKKVTMCFGYSQTIKGRNEFLIERAYEVFPKEKDVIMENYLKDYSKQFEEHFNNIFPGLVDQINIVKNVVSCVVKERDEMVLDNILGVRMSWKRFATIVKNRKAFHPVTRKKIDFSIRTIKVSENGGRINDYMTHRRQILSYIIHSIDASVIQYLVLNMFKKHNVIINTLHDCILLHPNYVEKLYNIINDLYKSDKMYDLANICFFKAAKESVSANSKPKIEKMQKEFEQHMDNFEKDLKNIDVRSCYKGEH